MSQTRRRAAIVAADVAGYSRLVGADEEGTLAALTALRRELAHPKIEEHHGRIVRTTGDGLLVEFASVVDAMRCAVEVQRDMAQRNDPVPIDRRIEFRIGINPDCAPTSRRGRGSGTGVRSPSSLAIPKRRRSSAAYWAARRSACWRSSDFSCPKT